MFALLFIMHRPILYVSLSVAQQEMFIVDMNLLSK